MQCGHTAQCAGLTRPQEILAQTATTWPKLCRNHDHKKSLGLWGLWTRRGNCNGPDAMWPHRTVCWDTALLKQRRSSSAATMTTRNPTKKIAVVGLVDQTRKLQRARYDVAIPHSVLRHGLAQTATPKLCRNHDHKKSLGLWGLWTRRGNCNGPDAMWPHRTVCWDTALLKQRPPSSAATMTTRNPTKKIGVVGLVDQTRKLQRARYDVAIPHSVLRHGLAQTATPKLCRNHDHKKSLGLWGLWTRRGNCNGPDAMWPHRTVCWDTALLKQRRSKLCRNHDHKKSHQENRGCGLCGPDEEIATSQIRRGHTAQCAETRPCSNSDAQALPQP
jgi:hypothetical protein